MYAITILVPFLLALDAMFAAPFGGAIGLVMISCLSGYDDSDPSANIVALLANTLTAICVKYAFGGGVLREIHGIALMCACKDSWGVTYPSATTVATTMIMHKFLTCDKNMFILDLVMIVCAATPSLRRIPLQVLSVALTRTHCTYLFMLRPLALILRITVSILKLPLTLWRKLCRVLRKPKMIHASTQMDAHNKPRPQPQLAISAIITVTDTPPITSLEPPMPTPIVHSHESVLEIFRKTKPRITFLRRSLLMKEQGTETGLVEEILQAPGQTISSREYLRNKWAMAKQHNQPKPTEGAPKSKEPVSNQPSILQSSIDRSSIDQPTIEQPIIEQSVIEKPTPEESAPEKLSDDMLSIEMPPIHGSPISQPAEEEPLDFQPAVEQLVIEQAVAVEGHSTENPSTNDPTTFELPPAEQQSIVRANTEQPTSQYPEIQEMPLIDQLAETNSIDEPTISETLKEEPSVEQYAIEQPSEEPIAEDHSIEQLSHYEQPSNDMAQWEEIIDNILNDMLSLDDSQQVEDNQFSSEQIVIHEPHIFPAPAEFDSNIQFLENPVSIEQAVENGHLFDSEQHTLTQPTPAFTYNSEQSTEAGQSTSALDFGVGQSTPMFSLVNEQPTEVEQPAVIFNFGAEQFIQPEQHTPISSFLNEQPTQAPQPIPVLSYGNEQFTEAQQPDLTFNFGGEQYTSAPYFVNEQSAEAGQSAPIFDFGGEQSAQMFYYDDEEPIEPEQYASMSYSSHPGFTHIGQLTFPEQSQVDQGSSDHQNQQINANETMNSDHSASMG
ncbi:hypothetical protein F4813DRAFT_399619 [Daldinia decipiens]|uniref:uncharacterized protein n=1 Tax=Daldinia decipiens TaxID=326647 RepID=UPI0020C29AAB|nr:uncharacterized protein F4813DRAFT_399619 [Daldinia decipiens]KAI1653765.1 hypothetical protein F4813DRAFT_399619 [Daldinia decipiens]